MDDGKREGTAEEGGVPNPPPLLLLLLMLSLALSLLPPAADADADFVAAMVAMYVVIISQAIAALSILKSLSALDCLSLFPNIGNL